MNVSSEKYWKSIRSSALSGNPDAEFEVAQIYDEGFIDDSGKRIVTKDPKRAVLWYRKSAEHGNPNAQNNFGYCLDNGYGIKKNKREALYWYKKAFRNGCLFSANNIATIYRDRGNERRAFFWYKRAAENNDGDALVEIGRRYYYGIGVKKKCSFRA